MNLFGEDFLIDVQENTVKDLVKKLSGKNGEEISSEKLLKSKKLTLEERLNIITDKVLKTLGKQKDNIIVIKNKEAFDDYVKKAITSGRIDIDTETNNSTDPVTCKLMGPCFYYPGGKQAYVPINHRDYKTKKRLDWQLTEADVAEQLKQIVDSKIDIIMHNGKFDYEVLKCTCGVEVVPKWDTLIAARLIDENTFKDSFVSLKSMYTTYIDPEQEKYSIDELFENIAYADVDPDIFAYYAATDALMTDKVYLWENETFYSKPENKRVKDLFFNIEMPILQVTAEIELRGVYIDQELGARLKQKYNKQLEDLDKEINKILDSIKPIIASWRLTPEANERTKQYVPAKTKMTKEKIEATYTNIDSNGNRYKVGKSRSDQLPDEVNLSSPSQFAILLYDILECPIVDKKNPRATGEDEIKEITDKLKNKTDKDLKANSAFALCNAILERRGLAKLITTYIDVIPDLAKHWPDGRIRYRLNSTGTDTGRFASGGNFKFLDENENPVVLNSINSQNLPSHGDGSLIRLLFQGSTQNHTVDLSDDNCYKVEIGDEVETASGWANVKNIKIGDIINEDKVVDIKKDDKYFYLYI
ncbi:DNA polymerase [Intestinibacter sp.]|uniref:DNA polymerase n=1 Tax=Intestinibacter sp. TaxID=1965304 RepID=UPI002A7514D9|nr:DNA polymerase [Intestinibacter sp.]MDY2737695.1 DNA polymerase [Intestinibacter sp.]